MKKIWRLKLNYYQPPPKDSLNKLSTQSLLTHQQIRNRLLSTSTSNIIQELSPSDSIKTQTKSKSSNRLNDLIRLGPLLFEPLRIPRHPIVLCHGLYGFSVRGPTSFPRFQIHYWGRLLKILRNKLGIKVIIGNVPSTGSIKQRALKLNEMLISDHSVKNKDLNILGHSMGGLDARYLLSHIKPKEYNPISLTTICTPHRGSPFMDWCRANIGVGSKEVDDHFPLEEIKTIKSTTQIPFSLKEPLLRPTTSDDKLKQILLNILDSPAYSNLSTDFLCHRFNPNTPNVPHIKYFSVAGRTRRKFNLLHPLWLPTIVLDEYISRRSKEINHQDLLGHDGLVTIESAKWGEFLGVIDGTDHWEMRGSSGFGLNHHDHQRLDKIIEQSHPKNDDDSNWFYINKLIKRWIKFNHQQQAPNHCTTLRSMSEIEDEVENKIESKSSDSSYTFKNWLSLSHDKLLCKEDHLNDNKNHVDQPHHDLFIPTINPTFPLDDLQFDLLNSNQNQNLKFDLELFYTALCRNLYDHGF
ncbi:hypothetical protein CROQUDRAFT_81940 [Cronartium quercuum f. sp. fusiforme G11]|uniref:DUF676 domain-containing protein n=1 Tax=Cronartium quercuum f. sp. fusiforme G11 TaxID=708437 RepID=A0A9P6NEL5_9BASI|nr:hypothetical protein CROQUDRAFT_81940 [Cronartium quercuum f. sp. fusiforme G11]